ncbi:MAG: hypothetical protein V5A34_03330 [Halapricum sp.]
MTEATISSALASNRRRLIRATYLGLFVALYYGTDLFVRSQVFFWLGIAGLILVFFDAVICARRRWRVVKAELQDDSEETEPSC